jgi:hypothetical protein
MAFDPTSKNEKGKRFSVGFNTSKELRVIVLKATQPVVLSGGIVTSAGSGKVNISACKYIGNDSRVRTAPAVSGLAITSTHHQYVDVDTNTFKSAAATPAGMLNLASSTHSGGTVTVTMSRLRLSVVADAGTDDLD